MINFQTAYGWVYQFDTVDSFLSPSAKPLKKAIEEALASIGYSEIDNNLEQIKKLARTSTRFLEAAEIHLICAWAYYMRGEMEEALQSLNEAGNLYISDAHKYAVTQWMRGCVLWELVGRQAEALQLWQRSLDAFELLQMRYLVNKQGAEWYQQQCEKMRQSIQQANPLQAADPRIRQSLYPVLRRILPSGTGSPTPLARVNSNQFWIGNRLYQLINLANTSVIDLVGAANLFALWVEDDTMDQIGIMIGDYVLIRLQTSATHNSIVLAVIDAQDTHAKLKNYIEQAGTIILRPQSTNPAYGDFIPPGINIGYQIKGIVLGVFKPI